MFGLMVSDDAIFSTFVTIGIFLLGYVLNRFYEWLKERRNKKEIRSFFFFGVGNLLTPLIKQADGYSSLADQIRGTKHQDFVLSLPVDLDPTLPLSISTINLYNSFKKWRKRRSEIRLQHLYKIVGALRYIQALKESSAKQFEEFTQSLNRYIESWNISIDSIQRMFDRSLADAKAANRKPIDDQFLSKWDDIIAAWVKSPDSKELPQVIELYIQPLLELCRKYPGDDRARSLIPLITSAFHDYDNVIHLRKLFSALFAEAASNVLDKKNKIESALKYFGCIQENAPA